MSVRSVDRAAVPSSERISCVVGVVVEVAVVIYAISARLSAEIRRLRRAEGWRVHTIARHLGLHHSTVKRALAGEESRACTPRRRDSMLDPYEDFVRSTLERYPRLPASVLHEMVVRRGYPGGPDYFRHRLAQLGLRPRRAPEAFFTLRTLPGEQAQVDWAHFGTRKVEGGTRRLMAFVMVLSYSRWIFLRFFWDERLPSFLAGHVEAFRFFGGVPRSALYDNLKSAVLEREGDAIRFHPRMLEMVDHYGFDPRPVAVARGNEKGRVERAIRYVRTSFFPLRRTWSLEALNRAAPEWCQQVAGRRPWPQDRRRTVEQAYREELGSLRALPEAFPAHEEVVVQAGKSPWARFDANRYSIPHDRIRRPLILHAEPERVRVFDRGELIAQHERCWDKGQRVETPSHLEALAQEKRRARLHRQQDRLLDAAPKAEALLREMGRRQHSLRTAVDRLSRLLDEVGPEELSTAIEEALTAGSPHPQTVRLILDRRRRKRRQPPPVPVRMPDDPRLEKLVVRAHDLADYDPEEDS